jgi:hypothetical protein
MDGALGVRFDIGKVGSGYYSFDCWKILWQALTPQTIKNSQLFEGDTRGTLNGAEDVYCIAIRNSDGAVLAAAQQLLLANEAFGKVAASPSLVDQLELTNEPLVSAGAVDENGEISASSPIAKPALEAIRLDTKKSPSPAAVPPKTTQQQIAKATLSRPRRRNAAGGSVRTRNYNPHHNEGKRALVAFGLIVLCVVVFVLINSSLEEKRKAARQAEIARQTDERRDLLEATERRAQPVYSFVASITRKGKRGQDSRARFLKDPPRSCSIISRSLGPPDDRRVSRDNNGMLNTYLTYKISQDRQAVFECFQLSAAEKPILTSVQMDGESISSMFWSLRR